MAAGPIAQRLTADRLHLQHGPIDIVLRAWGTKAAIARAEAAAIHRFETILTELASELAEVRRPLAETPSVTSPVAIRMLSACQPYADHFITPMAAVAGAVADEILSQMLAASPDLARAYVNDGGDIAVHLTEAETLTLGIAGDFSGGPVPALHGDIRLRRRDCVGGIATSGARGRSFSLGIADSVTVLAGSAAAADAAATIVANAVDIDSPRITRRPASDLDPDTDLADLLVTTAVATLDDCDIATALDRGAACADTLIRRRLIAGAVLTLQGETRVVTAPASTLDLGPPAARRLAFT